MEQLVIVERDRLDDKARSVLRTVRKNQEFSDRVFVVEGDANVIAALRRIPGILTPNQLTAAMASKLSVAENLLIDAWKQQFDGDTKARIGDGFSWGHGKFQAPR